MFLSRLFHNTDKFCENALSTIKRLFLSGAIGSNIVTLTTPYIRLQKESFLMLVDCIGTKTSQGAFFSPIYFDISANGLNSMLY